LADGDCCSDQISNGERTRNLSDGDSSDQSSDKEQLMKLLDGDSSDQSSDREQLMKSLDGDYSDRGDSRNLSDGYSSDQSSDRENSSKLSDAESSDLSPDSKKLLESDSSDKETECRGLWEEEQHQLIIIHETLQEAHRNHRQELICVHSKDFEEIIFEEEVIDPEFQARVDREVEEWRQKLEQIHTETKHVPKIKLPITTELFMAKVIGVR